MERKIKNLCYFPLLLLFGIVFVAMSFTYEIPEKIRNISEISNSSVEKNEVYYFEKIVFIDIRGEAYEKTYNSGRFDKTVKYQDYYVSYTDVNGDTCYAVYEARENEKPSSGCFSVSENKRLTSRDDKFFEELTQNSSAVITNHVLSFSAETPHEYVNESSVLFVVMLIFALGVFCVGLWGTAGFICSLRHETKEISDEENEQKTKTFSASKLIAQIQRSEKNTNLMKIIIAVNVALIIGTVSAVLISGNMYISGIAGGLIGVLFANMFIYSMYSNSVRYTDMWKCEGITYEQAEEDLQNAEYVEDEFICGSKLVLIPLETVTIPPAYIIPLKQICEVCGVQEKNRIVKIRTQNNPKNSFRLGWNNQTIVLLKFLIKNKEMLNERFSFSFPQKWFK